MPGRDGSRRKGIELIDTRIGAEGLETVTGECVVELLGKGIDQKECLAPCSVNLCPFDLIKTMSASF